MIIRSELLSVTYRKLQQFFFFNLHFIFETGSECLLEYCLHLRNASVRKLESGLWLLSTVVNQDPFTTHCNLFIGDKCCCCLVPSFPVKYFTSGPFLANLSSVYTLALSKRYLKLNNNITWSHVQSYTCVITQIWHQHVKHAQITHDVFTGNLMISISFKCFSIT